MRLVIQRVLSSSVSVAGEVCGAIDRGLLVLVGFAEGDEERLVSWAADKVVNLRIFEDEQGKMNRSVQEIVGGGVLLVPNFTLAGDAQKGRRPSFDKAMRPERAEPMFMKLVEAVRAAGAGLRVETGVFRAEMKVALVNDGPITIVIDGPTASQ